MQIICAGIFHLLYSRFLWRRSLRLIGSTSLGSDPVSRANLGSSDCQLWITDQFGPLRLALGDQIWLQPANNRALLMALHTPCWLTWFGGWLPLLRGLRATGYQQDPGAGVGDWGWVGPSEVREG